MARLAKKALLVAGGTLVALLLLELALRVVGYDPLAEMKDGRELFLRAAPGDLGYELTPGARGFAWGTDVVVNEGGYVGPYRSPGEFAGHRIVVLGDSVTFGNKLPYAATYPALMQEKLDPTATQVEVLNFGVGGYDILQYVAMLEARLEMYPPDVVVVGYCLNDICVIGLNPKYIEDLEYYSSSALFRSRLAQLVASRIDRLRFKRWFEEQNSNDEFMRAFADRMIPVTYDDLELRDLVKSLPEDYPANFYKSIPHLSRLRYCLRRLAILARQHDFRVVLAIIPYDEREDGEWKHQRVHQLVRLEAERAGLEVLDLADAFATDSESLFLDPVHPNAAGHRILAEQITRAVRGDNREQ
ncbi:MAG: SGNH/GDSL hydrolase family protein [Planctomycetota bacterium]|nr:MAG: SGNH/GDSL hydrolase family protein [Planctomycetota bacterium]